MHKLKAGSARQKRASMLHLPTVRCTRYGRACVFQRWALLSLRVVWFLRTIRLAFDQLLVAFVQDESPGIHLELASVWIQPFAKINNCDSLPAENAKRLQYNWQDNNVNDNLIMMMILDIDADMAFLLELQTLTERPPTLPNWGSV